MNRREFLRIFSALPALPFATDVFANGLSNNRNILVLVELKGANDGLNTLIPIHDRQYQLLRPNIAIKKNESLDIGSGYAMNKALQPLMSHWFSGELAWIQGLGYENPNRSHFRSIEIWESGSESNKFDDKGWVTKLYPNKVNELQGLVIGSDTGPLTGDKFDTIVMDNPESFVALTQKLQEVNTQSSNLALSHVINVQQNALENSAKVIQALKKMQQTKVKFPKHKFGKRMEQAANLIKSGIGASVYKAELDGFDTHRDQPIKHANLLTQLSSGLRSFSKEMQLSGQWENVIVMTYSEFGRRVSENKSRGTDHGTAAAHFVMGGRVKGGFHGVAPRLDELDDEGDIIYTSDFRSLYNTIATQWLGRSSPWSRSGSFQLIHS